jgi:broad specificity phosphatase PhoE
LFSFCINARRLDVGDAEVMRDLGLRRGRRLVLAGLAAGILVGWGGVAVLGQAAGPPATILLIRHAEKLTDGQPDLSPVGFERAKVIPQLFAGGTAPHNLPRPDFLFATHVSKKSNRPVETITPLSAALGLPISHEIDDKDYAALEKELLSGKYTGKVVLVAWHHGTIPMLARALGATPPYDPWPDTQFDRVWRIDYRGGKAALTDLPQELLAGDSR